MSESKPNRPTSGTRKPKSRGKGKAKVAPLRAVEDRSQRHADVRAALLATLS